MNRRLLATIAATIVIAACSDNGEQSPTGPGVGRPSLAASDGSCSFSDLKNYAKNLFGNGSPGHQLANQMGTFTAGSTQATNLGFDLFAAVAAKRNSNALTETEIGLAANLTGEIIDCSTMSASGSTSVAAFTAALGSTGAYAVRGDASKDADTPVITADGLSGVNKPSGETFATWLGKRTLFYGSPTTTFSSETSGGRAYDWSIVQFGSPLGALSKPALVSICVEFEDTVDELADFRVEHQGTDVETILPLDAAFLTCPAPATLTSASGISGRLIRLLAPRPLYALGKLTGSPTGNAGSFSPFEVVDPEALIATYASAPKDGKKNQPIPGTNGPVAVQITGAGQTAWQGVTVRVFGITNNGDKVAFSGNVAVTDKDGIASFPDLKTNKTGSYLLRAETQETNQGSTSFTQIAILSGKFNVRP
jgi:hypothetical protein